MESPAHSLSSGQLAAMLQRQFDEELLRNVQILSQLRRSLTADHARARFRKNRSRASSLADTRFVGNAFVDSSCLRSSHVVTPFCVQRVRQGQARTARSPLGVTCLSLSDSGLSG
jgi:hypothetical protein